MSSSTHQIKVKATDQTAGAFSSIKKRAAAVGSGIKNALGGALAAAGAYLGASAFVSGIKELGSLSDTAQRASVSVDELTKASTAMSVLGIKDMGVEQLANAFSEMEKKTGRTGMSGLYQTIEELGKINDVSQRASLSMEVFGESGKNLIPLINAADIGTQALQDVVEAMPGIPQSAADAGDEAADAMETIGNGVKSLWYSAIGEIVSWFNGKFTGGIREAAATASNSLIYYSKITFQAVRTTWTKITNFSEKIGGALGSGIGTFFREGIGGAWDKLKGAANGVWDSIGGKRIEAAVKSLDSGLVDAFSSIASGDFKGALLNVSNGVTGAANKLVTDNIKNLANNLAKGDFKGALESLKSVNKDLNDAARGVLDNVKGGAVGAWKSLSSGAKNAWNNAKNDWKSTTIGQQDLLEKQNAEDMKKLEQWTKDFKNTQEKIKRLNRQYSKAAKTTSDRAKRDLSSLLNDKVNQATSSQATSSTMKTKIANGLIMGGSNEATKLSILGPQTNELKKVNTTLDKIKSAVEQTARNTKKNDTTGITVKPM